MVVDYTHKKTVFFAFIDVLGFKKAFDDHRELDGRERDTGFADKFKEVFIYYFELYVYLLFNERNDRVLCGANLR